MNNKKWEELPNNYKDLYNKFGFCDLLCGKNQKGENVIITIDIQKAEIQTFQHNGFIRTNVYWLDGTTEELYSR